MEFMIRFRRFKKWTNFIWNLDWEYAWNLEFRKRAQDKSTVDAKKVKQPSRVAIRCHPPEQQCRLLPMVRQEENCTCSWASEGIETLKMHAVSLSAAQRHSDPEFCGESRFGI